MHTRVKNTRDSESGGCDAGSRESLQMPEGEDISENSKTRLRRGWTIFSGRHKEVTWFFGIQCSFAELTRNVASIVNVHRISGNLVKIRLTSRAASSNYTKIRRREMRRQSGLFIFGYDHLVEAAIAGAVAMTR